MSDCLLLLWNSFMKYETEVSNCKRMCEIFNLPSTYLFSQYVLSAKTLNCFPDIWYIHSHCMSSGERARVLYVWWLESVVGKVHRSRTWVKVQIGIIKYYSSKSKSTAFSILLEWKFKSTQFFMYLSKKVLIDRFNLQFYIDYFI